MSDVPSNFRRSNDLSAGVPNRRNRKRNLDRFLVLAHTNGAEVFDRSPRLIRSMMTGFFVPTIERDNQRNVLAYRFAGGVAKQPLRTCVPFGYDAFQRLADNSILR